MKYFIIVNPLLFKQNMDFFFYGDFSIKEKSFIYIYLNINNYNLLILIFIILDSFNI